MKTYIIKKEDIPDIAGRIPFEQLSELEQHDIVELLGSQEDYNAMRIALLNSQHIFRMEQKILIENRLATPQFLHNALSGNKSAHFLVRPIPLYQTCLAIAASIAIFFFLLSEPKNNQSATDANKNFNQRKHIAIQTLDRDSLIAIITDSIRNVLQNSSDNKPYVLNSTASTKGHFSLPAVPSTEKRTNSKSEENPFVGLDNLPNVLTQNKGVSGTESNVVDRFAYKQISMR